MKTKVLNYIIPALLIVYSLLLSLQGLDFGDAGWQLTAYSNFIKFPEGVHYSFMFWLSSILGNLWHSILPDFGMYWSRVGVVVLLMSSFYIYRNILKTISNSFNWSLVLGLMYLHIFGGGPEAINYEYFTVFFLSIAIWFLYKGLTRQSLLLIFIFGFVLGINLFVKISNLVSVLLFTSILFYAFIEKWKIFQTLKYVIVSVFGFFLALLMVGVIVKLMGHWQLFLDNIQFVSNMAKADNASHGFVNLLFSYIVGYSKIIIVTVLPLGFIVAYKYFIQDKFVIKNSFIENIITLGLVIISTYVLFKFGNPVWSKVRYAFYGLLLLFSFLSVLSKKMRHESKLLIIVGLILVLIAPLGSDSGLEKIKFGVFLLGSIFLFYLRKGFVFTFKEMKYSFILNSKVFKTSIILLFIAFISFAWNNTYNDPGSRLDKTYTVNNSKLKYIFTTKERAIVVNELLEEIEKYVKPNDYLLTFNELPMLSYLTDTKPFISTSWVKLIYSDKVFIDQLYNSAKQKGLPVVVRQKTNMGSANWPTEIIPDYTSYKREDIKYRSQGLGFNKFLQDNNYQLVWQNSMFEILIPYSG